MDESDDFFARAVKWYFIYRFLWACLGLFICILLGIGAIVYKIFEETSLELSYRHKYGADWQAHFEQYHGSVSHAHAQIAICVTAITIIVGVLAWFCRQTFHRHRKHRFHVHTEYGRND